MKKIAILGSNSFLANGIYKALNERYIIKRFGRSGNYDVLFSLPENPINVDQIVECDCIIYCAAVGVQAKDAFSDEFTFHINTYYPINLIKSLDKLGFRGRFISFGSYAEIGIWPNREALTEDQVISSQEAVTNVYSESKRALTRHLASNPPKIDHVHFILPNFYGLGENENRLLPTIARAFMNKTDLNLTAGTQVRQYVAMIDLVELIESVIIIDDVDSGVYNVGSGEVLSVIEVVSIFEDALETKLTVHFGTEQRSDLSMPYLELSNEKTYNAFDWSSKSSIAEHFQAYCDIYKSEKDRKTQNS